MDMCTNEQQKAWQREFGRSAKKSDLGQIELSEQTGTPQLIKAHVLCACVAFL